jgi:4-hydroxy-tetrahydrodipicolinate reductase
MNRPVSAVVFGASGRMGQAVLQALVGRSDVAAAAALVRPGSPAIGEAAPGGLRYASALPAGATPSVLIDFSGAAGFDAALALALAHGSAFVSGSTGLAPAQRDALERAAASIPTLWSANFSLGVALLGRLAAEAARALPDWDCEIVEAHHERKRDAPSGTALALGREVAAARGRDLDAAARHSYADAPRRPGDIGFAVVRAADIVGEHTVLLATPGERIELVHRATDRAIFARGAVAAARWLAGRAPRRYALADVLAAPA